MIVTEMTKPLLEPYLKAGFHDLPFDQYLRTFGASSHGLMDMRRSPKYYRHKRENQNTTRALNIGRFTHMLMLEPERAFNSFKKAPKVDKRTTIGKQTYAEFMQTVLPSDIVVEDDDYATIHKIRDSLLAHKFAKEVMNKPGPCEQAGFWIHEATETFCKIRPDKMFFDGDIIVDLKTTANAHPGKFTRDIYNLHYDMQAAFYLDGYRRITGRPATFIWLCVETSAPYDIASYACTDKIYGFGKVRYEKELHRFAHCFKHDFWPGYAEGILPLDLPPWVETAEQSLEDIAMYAEQNL